MDEFNENTCTIEIVDYDCEKYSFNEYKSSTFGSYGSLSDIPENSTRWINVDGDLSEETINMIGSAFKIHPLVVDDVLNNSQRAKIEDYGDYLFIVAKMIYYSGYELVFEHISFILGKNYIISIGEARGDVFDSIRERIRIEGSHIRQSDADYLMYSLLDSIVDGYFSVLESLSDKIDFVEEQVMENSNPEHLQEIRKIRKELLYIHKYVWPLREVASWMGKDTTKLIKTPTELYIRDVYDHVIQVIDTTETYREILAGLVELYTSNIDYRLNEIMKVLTILSTIFIPLTFIVGVYGMNFKHMPELNYIYGYGITWLIMIIIAVLMVIYFRKRKWF
jgi:magnesium transporter